MSGKDYPVFSLISGKNISFRKYLWRAAVIIPLAGAIIAVSLKTDLLKTRVEAGTLNPLVSAEFENNKAAVDESITKNAPVMIDTAVAESSDPKESEIAAEGLSPLSRRKPLLLLKKIHIILLQEVSNLRRMPVTR